jgi:hypothetical protein
MLPILLRTIRVHVPTWGRRNRLAALLLRVIPRALGTEGPIHS